MLNTPNEWHNEEDTEEYIEDEDLSEEQYQDGDQYDDGEYEEDDEYADDEEEYEDDDSNVSADSGLKKKIIIAVAILVVFLLIVGGIFGIKAAKNKNAEPQEIASVEAPAEEAAAIDIEAVEGEDSTAEDGEVAIDVEFENNDNTIAQEDSGGLEVPENTSGAESTTSESSASENTVSTSESSGLEVPSAETSPLAAVAGKQNNDTVTISIGDIGRRNPFKPNNEPKPAEMETEIRLPGGLVVDREESGLNFDVIEPPELGPERADIAKLLQTRVTGILFDSKKPSAIVNIDGADQLIRIGDNLGGFEIISITKNKVVIRDGNNVYRASVGQPLNAEKIQNPVEISNLETKFWGSTKH